MKFRDLIDKEDIMIDSKRLSEWQRNTGKFELFRKIDVIRDDFIDDYVGNYDLENISLICDFVERLKDRI